MRRAALSALVALGSGWPALAATDAGHGAAPHAEAGHLPNPPADGGAVAPSADAGAKARVEPADAGPPLDGGVPPRGLSCLSTWYSGRVTFVADGGWGLALDAGFIPWRNHKLARDAGEAEEEEDDTQAAPSLSEIYETPYQAGPIVPVVGDDEDAGAPIDPGRVRVLELFSETYGGSRTAIADRLTKVRFAGVRYPFHQRAAPALEKVAARLDAASKADPKLAPFLKNIGGTWNWRRIARSTALSSHAYGIAIDLNVDKSTYWRWQRPKKPLKWQNKMPQAIVDAFEAEGFIWGGRWIHYDTMHFEYRPELTSPACKER